MLIIPEAHGLRVMQPSEAALFAEWEKLERPYPWTEGQFLETLHSEKQQTLVWEEAHALIGFAVLQIVGEESYLLNIMIKLDRRNAGKGEELIKRLIEWSRSCGAKNFFLDVDPANAPAVRLYTKTGFQITGRRAQGYPRGEESVLMRQDL